MNVRFVNYYSTGMDFYKPTLWCRDNVTNNFIKVISYIEKYKRN